MPKPAALMIQATGSDAGKSLLVAGLCRAFARRGLKVAPFKPQNMSNNAAVTPDGGEIGRAQALQARACGLTPDRHMNPVLLKPQGETGSQVVVQGRVLGQAAAVGYQRLKSTLLPKVLESFEMIGQGRDLVIVEGAGSAAEVNLREGDIANMGFAEAADLPVLLVGDIDRGGVIASLVGIHALLPDAERARVKGWIINKFRGDAALFTPAMDLIEARTLWPGLGIVPWFASAERLPAEDGASLSQRRAHGQGRVSGALRIVVPRLPRIANFDDFDPLAAEPDVRLDFIAPGTALPGDADLVILPGSKATLADLAFLRDQGWDVDLAAHRRRGGRILGICAGYQMLGSRVADPLGLEGPAGDSPGLGMLDVATTLAPDKILREVKGFGLDAPVHGYEMHMGRTQGADAARPFLALDGRSDGAVSADGRVMGCYLHGLFSADAFRARFLALLRPGREGTQAFEPMVEATLDRLADHLETHLDLDRLWAIAQEGAQDARSPNAPLMPPGDWDQAAMSHQPKGKNQAR